MSLSYVPLLSEIRTQLATALMPRDDDTAKRIAVYGHRSITVLSALSKELPALQRAAMVRFAGLLDNLIAELNKIDGGQLLVIELVGHVRINPDYELAQPFLQKAVRFIASNPSENGTKLLREIASITFEVQKKLRQAIISQDIKPVSDESAVEPLDAKQKLALQTYLRGKYPGESALEIGTVKAVVIGGSKQTLFVELRNAKELPEDIVIRIDRAGGLVQSTVMDEFKRITIMHESGVPVPVPYFVESDTSLFGSPFLVVGKCEGRNIGEFAEIFERSRTFAVDLAHALAKMHQIPPELLGDRTPGVNMSPRQRVLQDLDTYENNWRTLDQPSIAIEQSYAWLRDHIHFADGKRSIVHADVALHNILAKDGHLTALLDWETTVIGNPAQDIGYVYHTVAPMMPWDEFLIEYEKAGGTIPSAAEIDFYRLLAGVSSVYYCGIARSYFSSGVYSSMVLAYSSLYVFQYCEHNMNEMLNHVYERY